MIWYLFFVAFGRFWVGFLPVLTMAWPWHVLFVCSTLCVALSGFL